MAANSGGPIAASGGGDGTVHTVAQGECLSSIASDAGLFWQTIWNHPSNSQLKAARKDPNVLLPGDQIFVPRLTQKQVDAGTDQLHKFMRKGVPAVLCLQVLDNGEIQANAQYILIVDGQTFQGTTDSEGKLEQRIPCHAQKAKLLVGPQHREYLLNLGELDPLTELCGVQGRLRNLDYYAGPLDGTLTDETRQALREFQTRYQLETTGEPDEATRRKLQEVHGS